MKHIAFLEQHSVYTLYKTLVTGLILVGIEIGLLVGVQYIPFEGRLVVEICLIC